jgi:hypothetical protein
MSPTRPRSEHWGEERGFLITGNSEGETALNQLCCHKQREIAIFPNFVLMANRVFSRERSSTGSNDCFVVVLVVVVVVLVGIFIL